MIATAHLLRKLALCVLACAVSLIPTAAQAQQVQFYHLDAIGNVRAVTDSSGSVIERHDYLPFGEECATGPCASNPGLTAGQPKHFTGKERDTETGLDYFGARYYRGNLGRFTTVDPAMNAALGLHDPQRWNRYAYGRNNPFRYVDPDGQDWTDVVNGAANAYGSNGLAGAGRVNPHNDDYATGQFVGDVLSIPGGLFEAGTGAAIGTGGTLVTVGSAGSGSPVSVPVATAGAVMVVQGGTQVITGAVNAGIYLSKKSAEGSGKEHPKKDRSLEGAQDQLDSIQHEQEGQRRGGRDKIDSTKKSEQNLDKELKKIRSTDDLKSSE